MSLGSIGSIGSTSSFWQQDQAYWNQAQSQDATIAATDNVISAIQSAETNLGKGLASIANGQALQRVNSQLVAGVQSLLQGHSGSSSSSATAASFSSNSGSPGTSRTTSTSGGPATGIGSAVLTTGTPLSSLWYPARRHDYDQCRFKRDDIYIDRHRYGRRSDRCYQPRSSN